MGCVKVTEEHQEVSSSADRYVLLKQNIKGDCRRVKTMKKKRQWRKKVRRKIAQQCRKEVEG